MYIIAFTSILSLGSVMFPLHTIMAIPSDIVERGGDMLFGRTVGIVENENGQPLWLISGIWRTNLSNQTQAGDNSTVFNSNFEMIKPDGTAKHTHTLTDFVLTNVANQNNNTTVFNGTGTISMPDTPFTEVPISIKVMNKDLGIIYIDPNKVDNHFGTKPIFGIPLEEKEHNKRR